MTPSAITRLRDMVPLRPLHHSESLRIAELQAQQFLKLANIARPSVPERIFAELPRVEVARLSPFPTSGASHWAAGRWLVAINGAEPVTRQRFSMAHEFKHIIDHRFVNLIYSRFPKSERHDMIEQICDYFAGCLLMPRPWVKHVYCSGIQDLPELARRFGVSQAAMAVRLNQIGLTDPTPRCLPSASDWTHRALRQIQDRPRYKRVTGYVT